MKTKKILAVIGAAVLANAVPAMAAEQGDIITIEENNVITISDEEILVNGNIASEEPGAVYLSNDIIYYQDKDTYESGNAYGEGSDTDKHSPEEAAAHTVVMITEAGTYRLSGKLSQGQIAVDLGEDAKRNPDAVVTLILDNVDISCSVAPAVIFYNVYECNEEWVAYDEGETETHEAASDVDTTAAGAIVILADDSVNTVKGSHVAKIYKDSEEQKKLYKYDGAFYSKMSMNIDGGSEGSGLLNIVADNEGLNSEMHLTINGGEIHIQSQDDGINTNEDGVSVTTINGGELHIVAGLGSEGDGIDSNGYLVINGGTVIAAAKPQSDSGLDSDNGSFVNGGTVIATGSAMDWAESDSQQVTMNLQFAGMQNADEAIVITDKNEQVIFAYDPAQDETAGEYNRGYQGAVISSAAFSIGETYHVYLGGTISGMEKNGIYDPATITSYEGGVQQAYTGTDVHGFMGDRPGMPPEEMEPGERPEKPEGMEPGEWPEKPEGMEPGERPEKPEGTEPGERPEMSVESGENSIEFYLNDKVNAFSGVVDSQN